MFETLPETFRKHNLSADVRTLLLLRKAMERGLINTLGDIYVVLKGLIPNAPTEFGPFTAAFYEYFLAMDIKQGEKLHNAIARSEAFKDWRENQEEEAWEDEPNIQELIDQFLNEVHLTTFDIQQWRDGEEILINDDPSSADSNPQDIEKGEREITKGADYSNISLEELQRRMEEIAKQQRGEHAGGSHWIGTGGMSPYGHSGAAKGGIRTGGSGGGKMARAVIDSAQYYPVDTKAILKDDNIDAALAALKGIEDESTEIVLDIPTTIKEGVKQGGLFLPVVKEKITQKIQVLLLIDNGGFSMHPYIKSVTKLFSKMKTRFAHDLKVYYYHNSMYRGAYTDVRRTQFESIDKMTSLDKNYSVFVIGDADMAPYELDQSSVATWTQLKDHFKRIVWLNPMPKRVWMGSYTALKLKALIPMYTLTPEEIEQAVEYMNQKRKYSKRH